MATPNLIIGLGHRKRVGKDTFGDMLKAALCEKGYRAYSIAFAADLKRFAYNLFHPYGLCMQGYYDDVPEEREIPLPRLGLSPRQLWIALAGTIRTIHPDVWIRLVDQFITTRLSLAKEAEVKTPYAFIITDVRYPNEAEAIKSWGGTLVKVTRDSAPLSDDVADNALNGYDGWDHLIGNHGDLEELKDSAFYFASYLTDKR